MTYDKFKDMNVKPPQDKEHIVYVRLSTYHYDRIVAEVKRRKAKGIRCDISKILRYIIETGITAIP